MSMAVLQRRESLGMPAGDADPFFEIMKASQLHQVMHS